MIFCFLNNTSKKSSTVFVKSWLELSGYELISKRKNMEY